MLCLDAFSEVLQTVRLSSTVFCLSELGLPWAVRVEGGHGATFHCILEGRGFLLAEGEPERIEFGAGDCLVLWRQQSHVMQDAPATEPVDFRHLLSQEATRGRKRLRFGGEAVTARVLSGCFHFDAQPHNPLLQLLPPVMRIPSRGASLPWLAATLQFLEAEESSGLVGSAAVATRLGDVLFVQLLRAHLAHLTAEEGGWLRAMSDPQLSEALQSIHRQPARPWSLALLAREAGMGRSHFAERFREVVGTSPIQYLKGWRLQKASELLRFSRLPIKEVAVHVGYDCEISFTKAFRAWSGAPPARYRRSASNGASRSGALQPSGAS